MKVPHTTTIDKITELLDEFYGLRTTEIVFLPLGDMSYGYKVDCSNGAIYYLKLLDKKIQAAAIERARSYLPLLNIFENTGIFDRAIYPILNIKQEVTTETDDIMCILFPWVDGQTLADSYPFSEAVVKQIACQVAKLHKATTSVIGTVQLPIESYSLEFEQNLLSCLNALTTTQHDLGSFGTALAHLVLPKQQEICSMCDRIKALQSRFQHREIDHVLCHGDLWGGNIIRSSKGLYFIDWESAIFAPPEREMVGFITQRLADFVTSYNDEMGIQFNPDVDLLRFYAFQAQLRNLTQWMMNILYRNHGDEQKHNDLVMIQHHCLNRWQWIEEELLNYESQLLS